MRVNIDAARADEAWIRASGDKGLVRYGYYPHNVHFIVTSAQMAGDMPTAMREARKLRDMLDPEISSQIAWIQAVNAAPFFAAAQFAAPAQILAMQAPDPRLPYAHRDAPLCAGGGLCRAAQPCRVRPRTRRAAAHARSTASSSR